MAKKKPTSGVVDVVDGVSDAEASLAGVVLQARRRSANAPGGVGAPVSDGVVYVVNPRGCVHVVTREVYRALVARDARFRLATDEEIVRYNSMSEQTLGDLAGRPFGG